MFDSDIESAAIDRATVARDAPALERLFSTIGASLVLDCGCGAGDIAISLAKDGFTVLGLNTSEPAIRAARLAAGTLPRPPQFVCRSIADLPDARALFGRPFDAVLLLGDALSFAHPAAQAARHFNNASAAIRRGGFYVLQMTHYGSLPVNTPFDYPEHRTMDGRVFRCRRRRIDEEAAEFEVHRTGADGVETRIVHPIRIWRPSAISDTFARAGWRIVRECERLDGGDFDAERSAEWTFVAEKL